MTKPFVSGNTLLRNNFLKLSRSSALIAALALGGTAQAQTLLQFFDMAAQYDKIFIAAKAQRDADIYYREIAAAGLRPSITLGAAVSTTGYRREDLGSSVVRDFNYKPETASIQLSQPIYNAERLAGAREGDLRALRAEVLFASAAQELALRVARAWFNYLLDINQLALVEAQLQSLQSQKLQAQRMRDAGMATRTDVEETASRAEIAVADVASARASLALRKREFARTVGTAPPPELAVPDSARFDMSAFSSTNTVDTWVGQARERNIVVHSQRLALDIARAQLSKARAGFLPSLAFVASYQNARTSNYFTTKEATTQFGVQLSMNLYDGGGTSAQVGQADALVAKASTEVLAAQDEAGIKAADAALSASASRERVSALEKALFAATVALQGMEAGQKAGLRTNSDVLNATQQVFSVKRDLARERYTLISRELELRLLAGDDAATAVATTARILPLP